MSIPAIGLAIFWLGFIAVVSRPSALVHLAVFFAFFENTAVLIRTSEAGTASVSAWMFLTFLAVIWGQPSRRDPVRPRPLLRAVVLFSLACLGSLAVPLYVNGSYAVPVASLAQRGAFRPVALDKSSLLVIVPFLAAIGLALLVWRSCRTWEDVLSFLRTVVRAALAVALLALWQLASFAVGLPYPQTFFRSLEPERVESTLTTLGVHRLSAVAPEPSLLARVLLIGLAILVMCRIRGVVVLGRSRDKAGMLLLVFILLASASSSALIGLGALAGLGFVITTFSGRAGLRARLAAFVYVFVAALGTVVAYRELPVVRSAYQILVTGKSMSDSYLERTAATSNAWHTFSDFPILGVGLGQSSAYDLWAKMLSNVGLVGASLFLLLLCRTVAGLWRAPPERQGVARALLVSLLAQLAVIWLTGFYFEAAYFWTLLGLSWACIGIPQEAEQHPKPLNAVIDSAPPVIAVRRAVHR